MANYGSTVTVKLRGMMNSHAFSRGFADVREGKPFRDDWPSETAWRYERGRLLACVYPGPLREGRAVSLAAIWAYAEACQSHLII